MKITLLLLIVCLTRIYADDTQIFRECYRKHGIDYDVFYNGPKMTEEETLKRLTPHRAGCIVVCFMKRRLGNDDISIRKCIEDGLNKPHPDFTDAKMTNLRNEVERCKKEAKDDCDLMICLKPQGEQIAKITGLL